MFVFVDLFLMALMSTSVALDLVVFSWCTCMLLFSKIQRTIEVTIVFLERYMSILQV